VAILRGPLVIITLSVIMQFGFFKMTGRGVSRWLRYQHHFELLD